MNNLTRALEAWREIVGPEHVLTDPAALSAAGTATFATANHIQAIVRPGNRQEVRACVRVANEQRTPIYPVSTGKNWGYGSRVPPADGCVLVELHRLDRITGYDEKLAYVTVEPGVTFRGLHEFLVSRESNLMLSVTGSTPDSSPLGNALERGAGSGPYADRAAHVCGFEVVLPSGDVVHTGFGRFPGAKTASLWTCLRASTAPWIWRGRRCWGRSARGAQSGDTGGYIFRSRRYWDPTEVARSRSRSPRDGTAW